jgi:F-type H+-transporting ATPase subunit epsilon
MDPIMAEAFKFELVSPARLVISAEVDQVVVPGSEGYFTVLKGHAPFMSTVRPGLLEVTTADGSTRRIFVAGGFADASPAGLTVLAEQAIPVDDLKPETLAKEVADVEAVIASAKSDEAKRLATEKLGQLREVMAQLGTALAAH